jgi:hypothetical protein
MKRNLRTSFVCAILAAISVTSFAQRVSFGEYTGINFSNLHGNLTSNKWVSKPGPSAGFFVEYNLTRSFSVQTEIGFLTHYYEAKSYRTSNNPITLYTSNLSSYAPLWSSERLIVPHNEQNKWDFSFLRFPLILKYKTPTRLQLGLGTGVFYSMLMNDDLTKEDRNNAEKDGQTVYPPTHDWGYSFSADLSYPLTDQLRLFLSGRLSTGRKVFIEEYRAKNGATEVLFGIKFTPKLGQKLKPEIIKPTETDSSPSRCYIIPKAGVTMAWNSGKTKMGNYSGIFGPNAGFTFGYRLDKTVSLQTGIQFQQKGYALSDSSFLNHRYVADSNAPGKKVDTQVNFDYLIVPLNFNLSFGHQVTFYVDLGMYAEFMLNARCTGTVINEFRGGSYYRLEKQNLNDAVEGYYKAADFGLSSGLGFQFPFRNEMKFDIGIRYDKGLKNILKEPTEYEFNGSKNDLSFENSSLSLQFGILIPIPN